MKEASLRLQWGQLLALAGVHGVVDLAAGMLAPLMPQIREDFGLSLGEGVTLLAAMHLVCNAGQIVTGHLRENKTTCFFIPLGLLAAACLLGMGYLPRDGVGVKMLFALTVLAGVGVAVAHPEGLRGIYALTKIPRPLVTAVFLTGGYVGFGGGAWLATVLVERWGLEALAWMALPTGSILAAVWLLRVRLATEESHHEANELHAAEMTAGQRDSFWLVWAMALPMCVAVVVVAGLTPQRLEELGFELRFGGICTAAYVVGGALGSFFWAWLARNGREKRCCMAALVVSVPLLALYPRVMEHREAMVLLFLAGAGMNGVYPLMITMASHARGLNLGARMGLMLGGCWGAGSVVLGVLGWERLGGGVSIIERVGLQTTLDWGWIGCLISAVLAVRVALRRSETK